MARRFIASRVVALAIHGLTAEEKAAKGWLQPIVPVKVKFIEWTRNAGFAACAACAIGHIVPQRENCRRACLLALRRNLASSLLKKAF